MSRSALLTTLESASYAPARPRPLPRDLGIPTYIMRAFTQVTTTVGVLRPLSVVVLCGVAPARLWPRCRRTACRRCAPCALGLAGLGSGASGQALMALALRPGWGCPAWCAVHAARGVAWGGAMGGARSPAGRGGPTDGHCRAGLALGGAGAGRRVRGVLSTCRSEVSGAVPVLMC